MKLHQLRTTDNLAQAITLLQRFFREEGFATADDIIATRTGVMAGLDTCAVLVVDIDGQQVGVATVSSEFGIELGWWAEMGDLFVLPEWRGKGIAGLLVQGVEAWLRQRGISGYQVTVTPIGETHHSLTAYYRKLGFNTEGRLLLDKMI